VKTGQSEDGGQGGLRTRLIGVARAILEQEGLEALTLRAAARGSGVSHMAPYRHFESKDDLLAAVAEQGFDELSQSMAVKAGRQAQHAVARRAVGVAYVSFALDNPALYRLMFGSNLKPRERFPGLVAAGGRAFEQCIAVSGGKRLPHVLTEPPPLKAVALWSLVHGLANLAIDGLIPLPTSGARREKMISTILEAATEPPT